MPRSLQRTAQRPSAVSNVTSVVVVVVVAITCQTPFVPARLQAMIRGHADIHCHEGEGVAGAPGFRTWNPLIQSQVLYR